VETLLNSDDAAKVNLILSKFEFKDHYCIITKLIAKKMQKFKKKFYRRLAF